MDVLLRVIRKEFLQLKRDRKMLPMVFMAPVLQLVLLGYAANLDVSRVPLMLVDLDHTPASQRLVDRFTSSHWFSLVGAEDSVAAVEPRLVDGGAQMALVVGRGYGEAVAAGRSPEVQLIVDGSDSASAAIGLGYASQIVSGESARLVRARLARFRRQSREAGAPPLAVGQVELVPRVWYNPDLRSRWFYVPAVLAMVLLILTMVLSSMGVVREKEIGTMEQLIVTPVRPWQLIVGKLFPFAVIGLVDTLLVSAIAVLWFGVPLEGSLVVLVGLTMLFLLNTLGLGLLVSTLVSNQQQAMMTSAFLLMAPMIYLSGLLFPIENMPRALQLFTYVIPLRYYAVILRGVFLRGSGLATLWPQAAALAAFGVSFLTLAALRFQKRLD